MALNDKKKRDIFNFYSEYGFHHPADTIVDKLNICHGNKCATRNGTPS